MIRSPLTWVGGKYYMTSDIIALMPRHTHYVEVFGGALHVLFAKPRMPLETVNDVDGDLVNFWLVCRDKPEALEDKLAYTPYSRSLFEAWKNGHSSNDPVERAARWFFIHCAAFSGQARGGWSYLRARSTVGVPPADQFRRRSERIVDVCQRLATVQIECADFRVMLDRFGNEADNFLYLDPPYHGLRHYAHNFSEQDHLDLAALLKPLRSKWMLSYYETDLIAELYGDFEIKRRSTVRHSAPTKRGGTKPKAEELIIMNYEKQPSLF